MSDLEFDCNSDQEINENHSKLIDDVRQLDKGQRVKKPERSEPSLEVSEFHLVKSGITDEDAVQIEELTKSLGGKGHHTALTKKINAAKINSKVLPKPLEKPAAERIKRTVGFENTKKELTKWSGIIARNRTAASISFPLSQSSMKLEPTDQYIKRFRIQSELEKKLAELEPEQEPEQEKDEFPLTMEEILERRKEAAKFRAQESYKVAKAHRQNKIKSKKFHRIQRKERIKKTLKEFEELQKTDPQAALEKLEQLDRTRAEERMTLRHKSTGQWAKSKQVRAKYDKDSRQVLAEQLSISRELTQKIKKNDDSDEDEGEQHQVHVASDKENPWMNTIKLQPEIEEFICGYRKYWDERNKKESESTSIEIDTKENKNNTSERLIQKTKKKQVLHSQNPVTEVVEEYLPNQNINNKDESKKEDKSTTLRMKKKLKRKSNDKLGINLPKTKGMNITKSKVMAGTTSWSVTPVVDSDLKNIDLDIDDMFDYAEDKLQEKINNKLGKVKKMLNKEKKLDRTKVKKKNREYFDDIEKLGLKGQKELKPIINKPIEESTTSEPSNENSELKKLDSITEVNKEIVSKTKSTEIDPNKYMNMKPKYITTALPDEIGGEEEVLDDNEIEEDQHQIISEAFADDDVVQEFRKEKEDEIKNSQPEDINLHLPGWGRWGGKDIQVSKRKKRRFIMKFPKVAPRRDENKGDVVIIEEKCPKIRRHLVSELPFPFTSVTDFEASMRAPIGRDFVPEKTFSKLIQPALKTKMGKVIEPMTEDVLVKTENLKRKKPDANDLNHDKNKNKKMTKVNHKAGNKRKRRDK